MKAIMISIRPEWVAKILNGEKTLEIRKTLPKCDSPIDVYIYCTKGKSIFKSFGSPTKSVYTTLKMGTTFYDMKANGKVVAKFTLNKVERFNFIEELNYKDEPFKYNECITRQNDICKKACLSAVQMVCYLDTKALGTNQEEMVGYAWHIDNLKIFEKPKELSEFKAYIGAREISVKKYSTKEIIIAYGKPLKSLTRAPQSYCYIEV